MGKHGMQRRVYKNADPVFDTVLGNFVKKPKWQRNKREAWPPSEYWQPPER